MDPNAIQIFIIGQNGSDKTLMGSYLAASLKEAGFMVTHDDLPVLNIVGAATKARHVLHQLGVIKREVVIQTVAEGAVGHASRRRDLERKGKRAGTHAPSMEELKALAGDANPLTTTEWWAGFTEWKKYRASQGKDPDLTLSGRRELITAIMLEEAMAAVEAPKPEPVTPFKRWASGEKRPKSVKPDSPKAPRCSGGCRGGDGPCTTPEFCKPKKDPRPNWEIKLDAAIASAEPGGPLVGLLGWSTYRGVQMLAEVVRNMSASIEVKLWDWTEDKAGRITIDPSAGSILGRVTRDNFKPFQFRNQPDKLKPILKEIYSPKKGK